MTCTDCINAARRPWHAFSAACRACAARMLSRGPDFAEAKRTGVQPESYRRALISMGVLHEDVKEAAKVDRMPR
jgi:hypothetical protein